MSNSPLLVDLQSGRWILPSIIWLMDMCNYGSWWKNLRNSNYRKTVSNKNYCFHHCQIIVFIGNGKTFFRLSKMLLMSNIKLPVVISLASKAGNIFLSCLEFNLFAIQSTSASYELALFKIFVWFIPGAYSYTVSTPQIEVSLSIYCWSWISWLASQLRILWWQKEAI